MTTAFMRAVLDTLLPGEAAAPAGESRLPAGSAAGVDPGKHAEVLQPILQAIMKEAGDEQVFIEADEARRVAILQSVQRGIPEGFARMLGAVLPDYYEMPAVLKALGWRSEPPQPKGHVVPEMDEVTRARLERVRLGRQLWRDGV